MSEWQPIKTAPRDGTAVRIKGRRFITERRYTAIAAYTQRDCPATTVDWFPPSDKHDREGPYLDVTHWQPLEETAAP